MLGAERWDVVAVHLLGVVLGFADGGELGSLEDLEADVAAAFGPFVVLLGEHGDDEAYQRRALGKDPNDVGAAAYLPVQAFAGIVRPDLAPDLLGNAVNATTSVRPRSRCSATPGSLSAKVSRTRSNCAWTEAASGWS
jgi:hypothetical protein